MEFINLNRNLWSSIKFDSLLYCFWCYSLLLLLPIWFIDLLSMSLILIPGLNLNSWLHIRLERSCINNGFLCRKRNFCFIWRLWSYGEWNLYASGIMFISWLEVLWKADIEFGFAVYVSYWSILRLGLFLYLRKITKFLVFKFPYEFKNRKLWFDKIWFIAFLLLVYSHWF